MPSLGQAQLGIMDAEIKSFLGPDHAEAVHVVSVGLVSAVARSSGLRLPTLSVLASYRP